MANTNVTMREVVFQKSADTGYIYCMHCGDPIPRGAPLIHYRIWEVHEKCFPIIERLEKIKDRRAKEHAIAQRNEVAGLYRN